MENQFKMPLLLRRILIASGVLCLASSIYNPVFIKGGSAIHNWIFIFTSAISILALLVAAVGKRSFLATYPSSEVNWTFTPFLLSALISLPVFVIVMLTVIFGA